MPSFQVDQHCYSSALAAARAYASGLRLEPMPTEMGLYLGVPTVQGTADAPTVGYQFTHAQNGEPGPLMLVPFDPQPCGLIDWQDALQVSWLVAGVWLAVYAIKQLAKARG